MYRFRDNSCFPSLTNGMWAHGVRVHAEERHRNEGTVAPEA